MAQKGTYSNNLKINNQFPKDWFGIQYKAIDLKSTQFIQIQF